MKSNSLSLLIVLSIFAVVGVLLAVVLLKADSKCEKQLNHLGAFIIQYHRDHGAYPTEWSQMSELPQFITRCPNTEGLQYDIIDVSKVSQPSGIYPLIVDSSLQNHGNSIYILFTDGHVEWDTDRSKLLGFLSAHPEVNYKPK